jgi:hypothetical protein
MGELANKYVVTALGAYDGRGIRFLTPDFFFSVNQKSTDQTSLPLPCKDCLAAKHIVFSIYS